MPSLPPLVDPVDALSPAERARTARHTSLAALGELGQRRLAAAHVAVVGAGGLGSPVVLALAAAGVGTLSVIDDDVIEASNLQRQVLHRLSDVGHLKADSAPRAAAELAPETRVIPITRRIAPDNAVELLRAADVVIDGTDTFETREAVAGACEQLGVPLVWGSVQAFDAQVTVFWSQPPHGAPAVRLADLYPPGSAGEVPTCAQVGVLGALCLQVGSLLATEAIKLITGIGEPLLGRVLVIDALRARQTEVTLKGSSVSSVSDAAAYACAAGPTASAGARSAEPVAYVAPRAVADRLAAGEHPPIIDVREAEELASGTLPGAVHVPLARLLADPAAVSPSGVDHGSEPLIVVCQVGVRAHRAARALNAAGVDAVVLTGGIEAWTAALETAR